MLTVALALAPVFLLICTGYALRRGGIPSEEFWNLNDRLVYFVLMPALFFVRISEADLSGPGLASFAGVLYAGFFVAVALRDRVAVWLRRGMAVGTSVIQGASRFNTFVGSRWPRRSTARGAGTRGSRRGGAGAGGEPHGRRCFVIGLPRPGVNVLRGAISRSSTNPLILSILAGLAVGGGPRAHPRPLRHALEVLGQAALPIMLLCVGASLKLAGVEGRCLPVALSALGKLACSRSPFSGLGAVRAGGRGRRRRADLRRAADGRRGLHAVAPDRGRRGP
jgi:malonate transporter